MQWGGLKTPGSSTGEQAEGSTARKEGHGSDIDSSPALITSDCGQCLGFNWEDQIAYRIDYWLSNHPSSKTVFLLIITGILIAIGALVYMPIDEDADTLHAALWMSWCFVADPGTHTDQGGLLGRIVAFAITIGGMLIFALMIGIVSDTISERMDEMNKGLSKVMESDHTLLLGWSDKTIPTIIELVRPETDCHSGPTTTAATATPPANYVPFWRLGPQANANESEGGGVVVILAEKDKQEMEEEVEERCGEHLQGTQVVCRNGSAIRIEDLKRVNASGARGRGRYSRSAAPPSHFGGGSNREGESVSAD